MAIDYDSANSGLFTHLGKAIWQINNWKTQRDNVQTYIDSLETAFQNGNLDEDIQGLIDAGEAFEDAFDAYRSFLADTIIENRLTNESFVDELDIPEDSVQETIKELIYRMTIDSETINASTVTVGSVSAAAANQGNGTVLVTKVLDGFSSPISNGNPHPKYAGVDSELSRSETMTLICASDSYADGDESGNESFNWYGEYSENPGLGFQEPEGGSGQGPSVRTAIARSVIDNGTFEIFTSDDPGSWDIDAGTAATHIFEDTTNFYQGASAIQFLGDGSQANIQISQSGITYTPLRMYLVGFRYKASATDTVSQTFTVQFEGTGYTAASSEKVEITGDNFDTTWTLKYFWIVVPSVIPTDFELVIKATGTLNTGKKIYIDDVFVAPVSYHNGVGIAIVPGATPFVRGDRFTYTVSNNKAGLFQEMFRRKYGVQLPSDNAGTETISDSLVTS